MRPRGKTKCLSASVLAERDAAMLMLWRWRELQATGESLFQQAGATTTRRPAGCDERRYRPPDEPNRVDHPACQSGAGSRDRRLFRVVEPGSVAATAAALVSRSDIYSQKHAQSW